MHNYEILAEAPASGGLTCYGTSYARQLSISCTCMESPIELAAKEKCHLLKLDLPILVMPLSFAFLPVYTRVSHWLMFQTPPAVATCRKCHEAIIKIWRSPAKQIP